MQKLAVVLVALAGLSCAQAIRLPRNVVWETATVKVTAAAPVQITPPAINLRQLLDDKLSGSASLSVTERLVDVKERLAQLSSGNGESLQERVKDQVEESPVKDFLEDFAAALRKNVEDIRAEVGERKEKATDAIDEATEKWQQVVQGVVSDLKTRVDTRKKELEARRTKP